MKSNKLSKNLINSMILTVLLVLPITGFAQIPRIMNHQGYLSELAGAVDGTRQMTFSIYDVETDGTALWTETQSVNVTQGVYSVLFGANTGNPFSLTLDFSDQYYLGVQVETDDEMTPRQPLASVPYALNSGNVSNNAVTTTKIADGAVTDVKIGGQISSAKIESAGLDADTLDGMDSSDFGDGHSLDAADGNPVDAVYVDDAGNVGIGTTTPAHKLAVGNITDFNNYIRIESSGWAGLLFYDGMSSHSGHIQYYHGDDSMSFGVRNGINIVEGMRIISNGNVGIGTANPGVKLEVAGTVQATSFIGDGSGLTGIESGWGQTDIYSGLWLPRESVKKWTSVAMSADGTFQTAVTFETATGGILVSTDSGNTWVNKRGGSYRSVAMSADGTVQAAVSGRIFISTDSGNTWSPTGSTDNWMSVAMSSDGMIMTALNVSGQIYISSNSGATWIATGPSDSWRSIAMSADGTVQTAVSLAVIYVSSDSGNTWFATGPSDNWVSVAMSADGTVQTVVGAQTYISADSGNTWTAAGLTGSLYSVAMSADGTVQTVAALTTIHVSTDSGNTWTADTDAPAAYFRSIAMSADASIRTAVAHYGKIYISAPAIDSFSTASGYVGIGTTSPTAQLEVAGDILLGNSDRLTFKEFDSDIAGAEMFFDRYGHLNIENDTMFGHIKLRTGNDDSQSLVLGHTGNVGIGALNPSEKLEIAGGGNILVNDMGNIILGSGGLTDPGNLLFKLGAGGTGPQIGRVWATYSNSTLNLSSTDEIPDITIDQDGNVGIGTDSPTAKLNVVGDLKAQVKKYTYRRWLQMAGHGVPICSCDTSSSFENCPFEFHGYENEGNYCFDNYYSGSTPYRYSYNRLIESVNSTEIYVESTSGNVGIGTETPLKKLDVTGDVHVSGTLGIGTTTPSSKLTVNGRIESTSGGVRFPDDSVQTIAAHTGTYIENNLVLGAPNSSTYASVYCTSGDRVTGGGWDHEDNENSGARLANVHAFVDKPINQGWYVGIRNDTSVFIKVWVYAICVSKE